MSEPFEFDDSAARRKIHEESEQGMADMLSGKFGQSSGRFLGPKEIDVPLVSPENGTSQFDVYAGNPAQAELEAAREFGGSQTAGAFEDHAPDEDEIEPPAPLETTEQAEVPQEDEAPQQAEPPVEQAEAPSSNLAEESVGKDDASGIVSELPEIDSPPLQASSVFPLDISDKDKAALSSVFPPGIGRPKKSEEDAEAVRKYAAENASKRARPVESPAIPELDDELGGASFFSPPTESQSAQNQNANDAVDSVTYAGELMVDILSQLTQNQNSLIAQLEAVRDKIDMGEPGGDEVL